MSYSYDYTCFSSDAIRVENFTKSGEEGRRIYPYLNANIKALKTIGEYIETVYSLTTYDASHKQKYKRIEEFGFRSLNNHNNNRAITRSDIILQAKKEFGSYDNAFVCLLLYILLLDISDEKSEMVKRSEEFLELIPFFIKRKLYQYAREIAPNSIKYDNIYQAMVILYGDADLLNSYIDYAKKVFPDEDLLTEDFKKEAENSSSPIAKRVANLQSSALKKDALYTVIYFSLKQYLHKCKFNGFRTNKKIIDGTEVLLGYLDYFDCIFEGSFGWLGKVRTGDDIDTLKDFIRNKLTPPQREELCLCLKNAFELDLPEEG